jgi:hypothetical protein
MLASCQQAVDPIHVASSSAHSCVMKTIHRASVFDLEQNSTRTCSVVIECVVAAVSEWTLEMHNNGFNVAGLKVDM